MLSCQKGFSLLHILIGMLVVALVIGVIYFSGVKGDQISTLYKNTPEVNNVSGTPKPSTVFDYKVPPVSLAGWNTYIHPDMMISFKYPSNVIIDRNEPSVLWFAKKSEEELDFRNRSVWVEIYEQETSLETLLKGSKCQNDCKKVVLNNMSGYVDDSDNNHINYFLTNNNKPNKVLDIRFDVWKPVTQEEKDTFLTIISTLTAVKSNL